MKCAVKWCECPTFMTCSLCGDCWRDFLESPEVERYNASEDKKNLYPMSDYVKRVDSEPSKCTTKVEWPIKVKPNLNADADVWITSLRGLSSELWVKNEELKAKLETNFKNSTHTGRTVKDFIIRYGLTELKYKFIYVSG